MDVADERPLRADARRNRAAVVKAARAVFARDGKSAQMDDVARRAKVGVGTVYRHFPTKEALLAALAEDRFEQIAGYAADALEVEDPWEAFTGFLRRCADLQASDRALSQMLVEQPGAMSEAAQARQDLQDATRTLVDRAQAAGVLRADFEPPDVGLVMCGLSGLVRKDWAGPTWERVLALVLDGLRTEAHRTPMPR
jgi:AcrR family transcriptional regulator